MTTSLEASVAAHDKELAVLRNDISNVALKVDGIGGKIDQLIQQRNADRGTTWRDIQTGLSIGVYGIALFAGVTSGIIYLAGSINAPELAKIQQKMEWLSRVKPARE